MRPGSSTSLPQAPDDDVKHGALGHLSADEELQQAVCEALIDDAQLAKVEAAGLHIRDP